jgi:hypothetical protein
MLRTLASAHHAVTEERASASNRSPPMKASVTPSGPINIREALFRHEQLLFSMTVAHTIDFLISCQYHKISEISQSGRPEEFHLQSPSDPHVNLSIHTAPASLPLETSRSKAYAKRTRLLPRSRGVDHRLLRTGSSPSLQPHYRTFNTTTG